MAIPGRVPEPHGGDPNGADDPRQGACDLRRLVATLRALRPRGPGQEVIRDELLGKLAVLLQQPWRVPGGRRPV